MRAAGGDGGDGGRAAIARSNLLVCARQPNPTSANLAPKGGQNWAPSGVFQVLSPRQSHINPGRGAGTYGPVAQVGKLRFREASPRSSSSEVTSAAGPKAKFGFQTNGVRVGAGVGVAGVARD